MKNTDVSSYSDETYSSNKNNFEEKCNVQVLAKGVKGMASTKKEVQMVSHLECSVGVSTNEAKIKKKLAKRYMEKFKSAQFQEAEQSVNIVLGNSDTGRSAQSTATEAVNNHIVMKSCDESDKSKGLFCSLEIDEDISILPYKVKELKREIVNVNKNSNEVSKSKAQNPSHVITRPVSLGHEPVNNSVTVSHSFETTKQRLLIPGEESTEVTMVAEVSGNYSSNICENNGTKNSKINSITETEDITFVPSCSRTAKTVKQREKNLHFWF